MFNMKNIWASQYDFDRTNSVENVQKNPNHQDKSTLQRSLTCRRNQPLRIQRNLSMRNTRVNSAPSSPNKGQHRDLSCHSSLSRAGSFLSQDGLSASGKGSALSLGEKISSIINIPSQVVCQLSWVKVVLPVVHITRSILSFNTNL